MSEQTLNMRKWENVLCEGLKWSCISFFASWAVFLVQCSLTECYGFDKDFFRSLFTPFKIIGDFLILESIVDPDNWPGGMLVCYVAPLMIVGFFLGSVYGYFLASSETSNNSGCLVVSFLVVLAAIIGVVLVFVI